MSENHQRNEIAGQTPKSSSRGGKQLLWMEFDRLLKGIYRQLLMTEAWTLQHNRSHPVPIREFYIKTLVKCYQTRLVCIFRLLFNRHGIATPTALFCATYCQNILLLTCWLTFLTLSAHNLCVTWHQVAQQPVKQELMIYRLKKRDTG